MARSASLIGGTSRRLRTASGSRSETPSRCWLSVCAMIVRNTLGLRPSVAGCMGTMRPVCSVSSSSPVRVSNSSTIICSLPVPDRLPYAWFVRQRGDERVGTAALLAEGQDHPLRGLPLARHERGNRGQVAAVLIPVGDVVEQVFYRVQAQACELLSTSGTDTFHILGGGVERGPGSRSCRARCDGER